MSRKKNEKLENFAGERELRQCELCGAMTRNWQEHHYDYQRHSGSIITLCFNCHKLADERRRQREAIELNKPEPPEIPIGLYESWTGLLVIAAFVGFFGWIILGGIIWVLMGLGDLRWAGIISGVMVLMFIILFFISEYEERKNKQQLYEKQLSEYHKRLAEWEKQQRSE